MDGREALIPGCNRTVPAVLKICKEALYHVCGNMCDIQIIDALAGSTSYKWYEQSQSVPVAALRTAGQVALVDQVFQKEPADPRAELQGISHGPPPRRRIGRTACCLRVTDPVSG